MKRPKEWPDPPVVEEEIMEEKLPELTIACPICNDREHRMTILVDKTKEKIFIRCNKCHAMFRLTQCRIINVKDYVSGISLVSYSDQGMKIYTIPEESLNI